MTSLNEFLWGPNWATRTDIPNVTDFKGNVTTNPNYQPKGKTMNETNGFTPVAAPNAPATTPLTDEQLAKLLASKPAYVAEGDEVEADTPTVH